MTITYRKWSSMKARCYNPSHPAFKYYGGRGVRVADEWRYDFKAFLRDMGESPPGMWIDRIDNSKGYEPGNVRWVTPKESAQNRKQRDQVLGSLRQLAKAAGQPYQRVYQRVRFYGWTVERALSEPRGNTGPV